MYLSRIELNPNLRETLRALAEPQRLHGAVERCFGEARQRLLWRIDWLRSRCYLLLVSKERPDFFPLLTQFGFPDHDSGAEVKGYAPFLERIHQGQRWRFRLVANPVISKPQPESRGRVEALAGRQAQLQWLMRQQQKLGISLREDAFDIVHSQWLHFRKGDGNKVSIRAITYEGLLVVEDADLLRRALTDGVGRGKAYGLGMLTLMPPTEL